MAESALKRLLVQSSHYSVASLFAMVSGLITFPLLTRIFSVADYGVMNLVAATLTVSVAVGKFGVQHSIIRYHSEIAAEKSRYTFAQLYSTTLYGMLASGLLTMLILGCGAQLVPDKLIPDERLRTLLAIAALLVVIQVLDSALVNFLRADQETKQLMKYQVGKKYLGLALILCAVLLIAPTLQSFYSASLLGEGIALIALFMIVTRVARGRASLSLTKFSPPLYKELLSFGIPMMVGYELSGIVLSVGDRYVIEGLIGEVPLGLYGAAYNLCQYVQGVFIASVSQAAMPIYMKIWDQKGPEEASSFITRSLANYTLFGAPVIAGLAVVGPELLPSLASAKYTGAVGVLPWVIAGMVVDGANSIVGAGLFIHRKTRIIMSIVVCCALLNIGLNLLLVPRLGIIGSGVATLASYAATTGSMALAGRRLLRIALPWKSMLRAGFAATIMYFLVRSLYPGHHFITVGVRAVLGAMAYGIVIVAIDSDARALVRKVLSRFTGRA